MNKTIVNQKQLYFGYQLTLKQYNVKFLVSKDYKNIEYIAFYNPSIQQWHLILCNEYKKDTYWFELGELYRNSKNEFNIEYYFIMKDYNEKDFNNFLSEATQVNHFYDNCLPDFYSDIIPVQERSVAVEKWIKQNNYIELDLFYHNSL